MAKRKKKDRFYVEILIEARRGHRVWYNWEQYRKKEVENSKKLTSKLDIDHMDGFVAKQIETIKQLPEANSVQSYFYTCGLVDISFVIYRNWP